MLRPGAERIAALGGLHHFMDWPGPILLIQEVFKLCRCPVFGRSTRTASRFGLILTVHIIV